METKVNLLKLVLGQVGGQLGVSHRQLKELAPGRVGAGAQSQTLSKAQFFLFLLLLADHIQVPVFPHAFAKLDGAGAHILPCGSQGYGVRWEVRLKSAVRHTHYP